MIRRPTTTADGSPAWLLISQVDHAHLAARFAEHWRAAPFRRPEPRDQVMAAIRCHDDGWDAWERCPGVDPASGRPLDFTEMPLEQSLVIWADSVDRARHFGPLAAYMVAGHFVALLERSQAQHHRSSTPPGAAERFIAEQEANSESLLKAWIADSSDAVRARETARLAIRWLQFFDLLSLWFCCADRDLPLTLDSPGGPEVSLAPPDASGQTTAQPWPFTVASLDLQVAARLVPEAHYATPEALQKAEATPTQLTWRLAKNS